MIYVDFLGLNINYTEAEVGLLPLFERMLHVFDGVKYITNGIKESIPDQLQNILWLLVDNMMIDEKDYLQIFVLKGIIKDGLPMQMVIHKQEVPAYEKEHIFKATAILTAKIYIIDDETHSTMLLAEEY